MSIQRRVADVVADHPGVVVLVFVGLLGASVPVLAGAEVYLSIYELSPREEYYDHFRVLNGDLGWDNLGAVLMTRPPDKQGQPVTDPEAVRMMNDVELGLEELEFVEGSYSLAEIVRIMNSRGDFYAGKHGPGDGVPRVPAPPIVPQPSDQTSGFPEEGPIGDAKINASLQLALDLLGDQIYGNILAEDHQSALLVVVMDPNATGEEYRDWQVQLKDTGLALEGNVTHAGELQLRPLSIDIIYSTLDEVTYDEAPLWIMAAVLTATATMIVLFRRFYETSFGLLVLVVVAATTLAAALGLGVDFNLLSLLVAALIFAAGVDYAMHVISRYREERELGFDARSAMETTIRGVGPALLITTVTDTAGFATLYFSLIPAIGQFGMMVGVGMFVSFLTCLTLLPVLLMWADRVRGEAKGEDVPEHVLEARRERLEAEVRQRQRGSPLGRLGRWLADHPRPIVVGTIVVVGLLALPMAGGGVEVWGASYLEPDPILEEDTYAMQALNEMDQTFGIPNELAVLFYGDATDPQVVDYLDTLQNRTQGTHGITKIDSVPNVLRLYTTIINPDPRIDQDDDGLPDTQEDIEQAYDEMRRDPATSLLVSRVVVHDPDGPIEYPVAAHRLGIDPQPQDTLGEDVDNYRQSMADMEQALEGLETQEDQAGLEHGTTGLVVLGVEVVDAITRGNAASIGIMLAVVFALLAAFWRSPSIGALGMVPILAAVVTQYGLTAALGYQVTYVSLILTGMVMGIGVDDAVHFITRFREEIRRGRDPADAAGLANAEIGSVLMGTTITTLAPFIVILFSIVTWASQTALLVIPTLLAALLGTLIPLPALLAWHARRDPTPYLRSTLFDEKLELPEGDGEPVPAGS